MFGGGNIYLDREIEKPGSSAEDRRTGQEDRRTGCTPWFYSMSASTKINCAFNNIDLNSKKKFNKNNGNFARFKGFLSTRGISGISTINAPKWWQSAEHGNMRVMQCFGIRRRL